MLTSSGVRHGVKEIYKQTFREAIHLSSAVALWHFPVVREKNKCPIKLGYIVIELVCLEYVKGAGRCVQGV